MFGDKGSKVLQRRNLFSLSITVGILSVLSYFVYYVVDKYLIFSTGGDARIESILSRPIIAPMRPVNYGTDFNKVHYIFEDEDYKQGALERFQEAIQFDTITFNDSPNPANNITAWSKFFTFHEFLEREYTAIHRTLKLEKVNHVGLLYTWEGSDPSLKPIMLIAHQDVIPVDPLSAKQWKYPPFSGHFDGETIWGRGTIDCKNLMLGELEAVEQLIKDGFQPRRTVILAFGSDEEIGGEYSAAYINETLYERYGPDSIYSIIDEGAPVSKFGDSWFATPGTSEKGHLVLSVELNSPGGHSSIPPKHTAIGIISQLIHKLESNPPQAKLTQRNPVLRFVQEFAKVSSIIPASIKKSILSAEFDSVANENVIRLISKKATLGMLLKTVYSVNVIQGGVKYNALPEYVKFLLDSRISVESSVKETIDHILYYVKELINETNTGLIYEGKTLVKPTKNGYFNITKLKWEEPLPISPDHGPVWETLEGTIKHVFNDVVFKKEGKVHVAPGIMTANTDTKHYWSLTKNIFRFNPLRAPIALEGQGLHSINEKITLLQHLETIAFMYEYILNADQALDDI